MRRIQKYYCTQNLRRISRCTSTSFAITSALPPFVLSIIRYFPTAVSTSVAGNELKVEYFEAIDSISQAERNVVRSVARNPSAVDVCHGGTCTAKRQDSSRRRTRWNSLWQ